MGSSRSRRKLAAILNSDVVGYSLLMRENDGATIEALVATRKLMSRHISRYSGRVVDAPGDALLAEFPSAVEAVRCAVTIQEGLLRRNSALPVNRQMRVRIGVSLGDVIERDLAIYGEGVNVAARLQALALPNGVCISEAVYEQIESRSQLQMKFGGEYRVKNIAKPVRVFHIVVGEAVTSDSPAPAADDAARRTSRTNLPLLLSGLFGRDAAVDLLQVKLTCHSLVTVLGTGGIGKTRLAQVVASRFIDSSKDGVWWVDLSAVSSASEIAPAIAKAARLQLGEGDPPAMLARVLGLRELLLVLDNCEHLARDVAEVVQGSIQAAAGLKVLATSQEALRVCDEQIYRIEPLAWPELGTPLHAARLFGAIQLLEERAQSVDRAFTLSDASVEVAIDICRQLDGIPLAIEMAAARIPMLGLPALKSKLGDRLRLLKSGARTAPSRQQTLRATLDWSVSLLSTDERTMLRRLSVFAGSFRLDLAQSVGLDGGLDEWAALDALSSLVEKSLLQVERLEPPRYRLLETTRLYALEQLEEANEAGAAWHAHGRAMMALADEALEARWLLTDDELLRRYLLDDQDLLLAFERACERKDVAVVASTVALLHILSLQRSPELLEQRRNVAAYELLPLANPAERAKLWPCFTNFLSSGIPGLSRQLAARASLEASRAIDDARHVYRSLWVLASELAREGSWKGADDCANEAQLIEEPGWPARLRMWGRIHRATMHMYRADAAAFRHEAELCIALCEQAGATRTAAWQRHNVADAVLMAGDFHEAIRLEQAAIQELSVLNEDRFLCWAMANLCAAYLFAGDTLGAVSAARRALPHMHRMTQHADLFDHLALIAARLERFTEAGLLLGCSDEWYRRSQKVRQPNEARLAAEAESALGKEWDAMQVERQRIAGAGLDDVHAIALAQQVLNGA